MKENLTKHKAIRILTVSDFIDKSLTQMVEDKTLKPVDLIISCGDMPPEYLSFLRDRLDKPLFFVKGNHDIRYSISNPVGCENIHAKIVRFQGLNITGLEGSLWYNGGVNQYTDKEMQKIISGMWFSFWRKGIINLVITHAPPRHIHDAEDRCHMGFDSFVKLIDKREPDFFIHGHIHKEFTTDKERVSIMNNTKVINTCGYTILEVLP